MADEIASLVVRITAEDNASAALARVSGEINAMSGAGASVSGAVRELSGEMNGAARAAENYSNKARGAAKVTSAEKWTTAGEKIKEFGKSIDSATKPIQYLAAGTAAAGAAVSKAAMDYETAFTGVRKTVEATPEQLARVDTEIRQMAKDIPVSAAELANLAMVGGQLGVGANDITKFTETMAAMGVATNLSGEEGAASMARFMNVMGESVGNIDKVGSAIVHLGNNTATSEAEITDMAQRLGSYSATLGISTADTLAYSAAMSSLGIEAEMGGSALGRMWMDIQTAAVEGGEGLEAFAKYSGKSAEAFREQWSTDPSGAFYGLLEGLSKLDKDSLTKSLGDMGVNNTRDVQTLMKLANGYDTVTKCLGLSNTAYKENTALAKEANTAYGTTANRLQLAKNAVVDAGISWGNVLLPEIKSGAEWVGGLAEGFGNMNDSTKKAIVSGAKAAVVIGGISKVAAGTIKTVGGAAEGIGKIGKAFSAGGALAKAGTTLAAIGSAALPAAAGIAAVGAAAVVGYKAYEAYQNRELDFSKRLAQSTSELKEATNKYKELNDLQQEYKDLSGKVSGGKLEGAELEQAKARLEEIKQILSEQYKINVDSGDIDTALEKAKALARNEMVSKRSEVTEAMSQYDDGEYEKVQKRIDENTDKLNDYTDQATKLTKAQTAVTELRDEWNGLSEAEKSSTDTQAEFARKLTDIIRGTGFDKFKDWTIDGADFGQTLLDIGDALAAVEKDSEGLRKELTRDGETLQNIKTAGEDLASVGLAEIELGDTERGMNDISLAIQKAGLNAVEYAKNVSLAQNQLDSFSDLQGKSGEEINKAVSDYQKAAKEFGVSGTEIAQGSALIKNGLNNASDIQGAEALNAVLKDFNQYAKDYGLNSKEIALGTSLIQTGFNDLQSAIDAGGIDKVFEAFEGNAKSMGLDNSQIIEFANALNMIPEDKHIEISADGDLSLVDNVTEKVAEIDGKQYTVTVDADGNVQVLDEATGKVTELQGIGAVSIAVDANGNTVLLDEAGNKVAELKQVGNIAIAVDAQGNVTILDEAGDKIRELMANSNVSLHFNAETGNLEVLNEAKETIAEINQNGQINITANVTGNATEGGGFLDKIKEFLQPTAEAAEVPVNVNATPGTVTADTLEEAIKTAVSGKTTTADAKADLKVTAGNVDTADVKSKVDNAVKDIKGSGNTKVDVTVTAKASGTNEIQALSTALDTVKSKGNASITVSASTSGTESIQALSSAIDTVSGKNASVTVSANVSGTEGVAALSSAINNVQGKNVPVSAAVTGTAETQALKAAIDSVQGKSVNVTANVSGTDAVNALAAAINSVQSKTVTITANYVSTGAKPNAKGTKNFSGGLAMVNDERGVSDPRELIIDRGRAFIPRGRDVILPLSRGAKVYTASQTKRIMSNMGIPHYAEGKENSDAFTAASDDWTHYTKTHAVTVAEELEKWTELSKRFKSNIKDAEDIEEEIFALIREQREEQNELSEEYISARGFLNDWESWGDSAEAAFERVKAREYAYVADEKITEREAYEYLKGLGEDMYDTRVKNSEKWLDKQIRYCNMGVDEQIAALDRIEEYTIRYYNTGIINHQKYIESMDELDELRTDTLEDSFNKRMNAAERYMKLSDVFGYDKGDTKRKTIERMLDILEDYYAKGAFAGNDEDYWDNRADLLYDREIARQEEWDAEWEEWQTEMNKQKKLYDMWDMWDTVGGKTGWFEAYARRLQKFKDEGKITNEKFKSEMLEVYEEWYSAQRDALDEILQSQSDYIDRVDEGYSSLIEKKDDAFDMAELERDIAEAREKKRIYAGAVTQQGKDVYKDVSEELEDLEHQKTIKDIEAEQSKTVTALKNDYNRIEKSKTALLNSMNATCFDFEGIAEQINLNASGSQALIKELLAAVKNLNISGNTYGDTNYNITGADSGILSAFMRRGAAAVAGY